MVTMKKKAEKREMWQKVVAELNYEFGEKKKKKTKTNWRRG